MTKLRILVAVLLLLAIGWPMGKVGTNAGGVGGGGDAATLTVCGANVLDTRCD